MQYILSEGWEEGVTNLSERLITELAAGKKVLWLVSGGSNIAASVQIMHTISSDLSQGLSVMPADERYGREGHDNSNWSALMKAGFEPKQALLLPVLNADLSFEATTSRYQELAIEAFNAAECIVGQFGIGEDGHIAGILPESIAANETTPKLVIGYHSDPYERMTLTFSAIRKITVTYAFAFGIAKAKPLEALKNETITLQKQPAQILKQLHEAYVYNDQRGD